MTELTPEANHALYGNTAGLTLMEQLENAYERNVAEGRNVASSSLAGAAGAVVVLAEALPKEQVELDMRTLTEKQRGSAETLLEQFNIAYTGLRDTADALNDPMCLRDDEERLNPLATPTKAEAYLQLGATIMDWAERGILDYLIDANQGEFARTNTFSLIATPVLRKGQWSEEFTRINIKNAFGTFSYRDLTGPAMDRRENEIIEDYCRGLSIEQMCGPVLGERGLRFSLAADNWNITKGTAQQQRDALEKMKDEHPHIGLHVEPPMAQLASIYTHRAWLHAHGFTDIHQLTKNIHPLDARNFDLENEYGECPVVGQTFSGGLYAYQAGAEKEEYSRVSIW